MPDLSLWEEHNIPQNPYTTGASARRENLRAKFLLKYKALRRCDENLFCDFWLSILIKPIFATPILSG